MNKRIIYTMLIVLMLTSLSLAPVAAAGGTPLTNMQNFWAKTYAQSTSAKSVTLAALPPVNGTYPPAGTVPATGMKYRLLAKAPADECFYGLGVTYQPGPCQGPDGQNKVNQAYLWGLTASGDNLWFGTMANVFCLAMGSIGAGDPILADTIACEYGQSKFTDKLPTYARDWRPPEIYVYNTTTETLTRKTPMDANIATTVGLRSAGSANNVVFVGGPGFLGTVNLFAYRNDTGAYLGSTVLSGYNNIRKWLTLNGVLYMAVGSPTGGAVLRWTGDVNNPFQFEVVGNLDSDGAEIVPYNGRIAVSTWPVMSATYQGYSGIWLSPVVPAGGLTAADASKWTKVFDIRSYEPDPVVARTLAAGGIAPYGGYLYWSTLALPGTGLAAFINAYGAPANETDLLTDFLGTYRPTIVFRGKSMGTSIQRVELLYGSITLPVYKPGTGWTYSMNGMKAIPKYGQAGYGNFFNAYTWSMDVYKGQLYAGTFDWSFVAHEWLNSIVRSEFGTDMTINLQLPNETYGADLFRFNDAIGPARPLSLYGVGNYLNYGVRNILVTNGKLYIGSANPMNLATDPAKPRGGWELIELSK